MLLAYRDEPSFFQVGRAVGAYHQTDAMNRGLHAMVGWAAAMIVLTPAWALAQQTPGPNPEPNRYGYGPYMMDLHPQPKEGRSAAGRCGIWQTAKRPLSLQPHQPLHNATC